MASRADIRLTGAVYTPDAVASAIVNYVKTVLPAGPIRTLEPSVGDGAFLAHLPNNTRTRFSYTLVDINHVVIDQLRDRIGVSATQFVAADFLRFAMDHVNRGEKPYDLIIGNPPFIRKHNFSAVIKEQAGEFADQFDYPVADLKNTWAFFLVAALRMVTATGVIAFILPYELMTVDYGQSLLKVAAGMVSRIDIFISDEKAFPDIDQDAVIFIGRKRSKQKGVYVNRVQNFTDLRSSEVSYVDLSDQSDHALELSSFLITEDAIGLLRRIRSNAAVISDYANSAPGIVSAANEFFILTDKDAKHNGLTEHTVPILKKGSFAGASPIFSSATFDSLAEAEACRLLVVRGEREKLDQRLLAYIGTGEHDGIDQRYKCRHRKRWYEVPLVPVEKGFFFKRSHSFPRLIINEAGVFITDTAYGIRLKESYSMRGLCFSFYTSLTFLFAEIDGRFYGGGVLELSPSEFRKLPLVYHEPSERDWRDFLTAYAAAEGDAAAILDFGDKWLKRKGIFTSTELAAMRGSWSTVRAHRMRHGGRTS